MTRRSRTSRDVEQRLDALESEARDRRPETSALTAEEQALVRELFKYRREREAASVSVRGEGPAVEWSDALDYASQYVARDEPLSRDEFYGTGWWYDPEEWDPIVAERVGWRGGVDP